MLFSNPARFFLVAFSFHQKTRIMVQGCGKQQCQVAVADIFLFGNYFSGKVNIAGVLNLLIIKSPACSNCIRKTFHPA